MPARVGALLPQLPSSSRAADKALPRPSFSRLSHEILSEVAADRGPHSDLRALFARLHRQGYEGVECSVRVAAKLNAPAGEFAGLLNDYDWAWVPLVFSSGPIWGIDPFVPGSLHTAGPSDSVAKHVSALLQQVADARALGVERVPFVTAHTGHDSWPLAAAAEVLGAASERGTIEGVLVAHETHRGRALFSPWAAKQLVSQLPDLRLVADYSHYTCVAEAMPHEQPLHSVVSDPRSPEWAPTHAAFQDWWATIWRAQRAAGMPTSTLTPEAGPPPYQHTMPCSGRPTADVERVNVWVGRSAAARFAAEQALWEEAQGC